MPQGRKKIPFSGKAKKEQLKSKKQTKNPASHSGHRTIVLNNSEDEGVQKRTNKINEQPLSRNSKANVNRYALKFYSDTPEELRLQKEQAVQEIVPVLKEQREINSEDFYTEELEFPKRPKWSYGISREVLEAKENRYFTEYIKNIEEKFMYKSLGYFELNLETWRQLWRVLEMSDIILFIVDIRLPNLMFPPSLYEYVTNVLGKDMILVLNKIDLVPAQLVVAWYHYFKQKYPKLHIVLFTTLPEYNLRGNQNEKSGLKVRRRKGHMRMAAEGTQLLFEACKEIVQNEIDLSSWENKIKEETECEDDTLIVESVKVEIANTDYFEHVKYKNGILTIGCLGQPNVGKSSLMNAIMGKKVVSVSKTPGHTKHFQTIFLTQNIRLCDCPGLVFPSKVPKYLQVLMGSFPIAQLKEPYSTIRYLAERIDLVSLLKIAHPTDDDTWSVIDLCDGWAKKKGFLTAKAARLDTYRAANHILRMALDGKICLCLHPPGYTSTEGVWLNHEDVKKVLWVQAKSKSIPDADFESADDEDSESAEADNSSSETCSHSNKFALLNVE